MRESAPDLQRGTAGRRGGPPATRPAAAPASPLPPPAAAGPPLSPAGHIADPGLWMSMAVWPLVSQSHLGGGSVSDVQTLYAWESWLVWADGSCVIHSSAPDCVHSRVRICCTDLQLPAGEPRDADARMARSGSNCTRSDPQGSFLACRIERPGAHQIQEVGIILQGRGAARRANPPLHGACAPGPPPPHQAANREPSPPASPLPASRAVSQPSTR